ncbi:recombinase family protein [Micromonospora sp. NPDC049275]|uniref:recombinase family protein n=1 Tax=Micromonospora sp. NPDC049275 TaxID=3364268 RepID=UPI00371FDB69
MCSYGCPRRTGLSVTAMRGASARAGTVSRRPPALRLPTRGRRPHPNAAQAGWGRRLQRLEPDPTTAGHVRWMFAQRLDGQSLASLARALNDAGIPCPSGVDPDRNPHHGGDRWTLRTVAAIHANPRYTGTEGLEPATRAQRLHRARTHSAEPDRGPGGLHATAPHRADCDRYVVTMCRRRFTTHCPRR